MDSFNVAKRNKLVRGFGKLKEGRDKVVWQEFMRWNK